MCGISGILCIEKNSSKEELYKQIFRINESLNHRGPDDSNVWVNDVKGIALGHRRLSILDLSSNGRQPFISNSGRYKIVFNGEIYNYNKLKKLITIENNNLNWKSNSDTEVLIEAIDLWGLDEALKIISGMYAFAIWDDKENVLSLVRDKFGIKPIYYGFIDNQLLFFSELKGIKAYGNVKLKISKQSLNSFLKYGYISAPHTIYENIHQLQSGEIISFNYSKKPKKRHYWNSNEQAQISRKNIFNGNYSDAVNYIENVILESVDNHLISDVKVGTFLSGGIDSTLVTAMAQKNSSVSIDSYTIGFENNLFDESKYSRIIAKKLKTNHHEFILDSKELENSIYELPSIFNEPFGDSSSLPTLLLSKKTASNVKVALSGDGGDEMFAGYNRYIYANKMWSFLKNKNNLQKKLLATFLELQSENFINQFTFIYKKLFKSMKLQNYGQTLKKIPKLIQSKSQSELYNNILSTLKSPNKFLIEEMQIAKSNEVHEDFEHFNLIESMMLGDINNYMQDDILRKVDRTSMNHSLEVRVPLISDKVFEAAWKLPIEWKVNNSGDGKIILKDILGKYLDISIFNRPKMGFGIPLDTWLRNDLNGLVNDFLLPNSRNNSGLLNNKAVENLIKKHNSGRNHGPEIWNLLMFEIWYHHEKSNV